MIAELAYLVEQRAEVWFNDPVEFCNDVFTEKPREWQPDVMRAVAANPWVAVAACRKAGKTRLAAYIVLWFLATRPQSLVVTTAPVWEQLVQTIWADLQHLWKRSLLPHIYPQWQLFTTEIRTGDAKWRAIGVTSDKPENTEGRHAGDAGYVLVVMDESKGIEDSFFTSMMGMMGGNRKMNRLLAIGTPGGPSGWFYRAFTDDRELWGRVFQISSATIPRLKDHCEAERKRLRGGPDWRQQQLAEFTGADEGSIITPDEVSNAVDRFATWEQDFPPEARRKWQRIVSLDPAGPGKDESVLTYRYGPVIERQEALPKFDTMLTASEAVKRAREYRASILVVDSVGLGEGITDRIRQLFKEGVVIGFKAGRKANDSRRFDNVKSEVVFHLKALLEDGKVALPDIAKLRGQLCSWTFALTARDNKIRVSDPLDSPDWADSAMLVFAPDIYGGGFGHFKLSI